MLGGIRTDLLVTVTLLCLSQTATRCRAADSLVTLPDWRAHSEYVTQCFYDGNKDLVCDWTRSQLTASPTGDVAVNTLESAPLGLDGEACLEFWYLAPLPAGAPQLRALLKSSTGLREIWTSPALPGGSWRQVFVQLNITEPGTKVVLEEASAVSTNGRLTFNQIGVRRGSCGQQCEPNTELWTDESTRCRCSAGQLSCSPSQCPEGQTCSRQTRASSGASAMGTCTVHGNTDCSTFDGVLFHFTAPCAYTLAKSCFAAEALPVFTVEVVSEQNGNSSVPVVRQVIVEISDFRVSLMTEQTQRAVVNGVWRKLPLTLGGGAIQIKNNPAAVTLKTHFGLSVSYDKAGAVHVNLPPTYSNQVCGLCGNFNHFSGDDLTKPDGADAEDATALAQSWRTKGTSASCEAILVPHQCDPLEEAEYAGELYCGGLVSGTGPFADCLSALGAESYFRSCVMGMCSSQGDPRVLCEKLQFYANICQAAGVAVPVWRNSTYCTLQCGENSHYSSCANGCPEVCSGQHTDGMCGSCVERCECNPGFKLSGGKCVPPEDCGCWRDGKHYDKGQMWLEGECSSRCQCMGENMVQCAAMQCANNEVCKFKDGVKGCFPIRPTTCSVYGDPHYITFDGLAYDFHGGCSYMLTTTCGEGSSVQFKIVGHNVHCRLHDFSQSKLEAVALHIEDLHLILNQSREVYVNNVSAPLPYSTRSWYGSVRVYEKTNYIIMETTFGLRMTIDGQNRLFLQVDERYKYELCGLCGTFSEYQDDDFITPGGQNAIGPFEFGDSWRVQDNNDCITHPSEPALCDYNVENDAYNQCSTLLKDAFKPCHELIHPSIYIDSCVYDYCATSGDQHTLCESLKSYAAACRVAGVELPHWQTATACAETPTTTTPSTTASPTSPTPDQTFCPMNCNFERNLCGWQQLIQDSFDWTRNSGPTPSDLTGPNQDHTTGAGFYMYIEGNSVTHGDSARLLSSTCNYDGPLCLHFWYHMYGSASAMALNIYLLKDNKATKLRSIKNNQGLEWHQALVDIQVSGPFQIILEGIRGSTPLSDVAIDDISIHFGTCSGSLPGPEITPQPVCNYECTFDRSLCSWSQLMADAFDWTWQSGSTPTLMTGPSADHTGGGRYLYIEASRATHGDTARLISSECSVSGPKCLQFWYHMYGSADTMGLHVYLLQNRLTDAVWWKRNNQGDMWQLAQVDFTTTGAFQIIIEGRRGSNEESDVAIDDIKLYGGRCSDLSGEETTPATSVPLPTTGAPEPPAVNVTDQYPVTPTTPPIVETTIHSVTDNQPEPECLLHCNFEQDLCHWSQLLADVFDWTRHRGSTPTLMTGPSVDHTTGDGYYLYIEANSASYGDTARLISSECLASGPQCLQFWYHMYGSADTMGLNVYVVQDRSTKAVWSKRNNQANAWHLAQVDLTTSGAFQIIFEGRRGSNDESDVAIDDVSLNYGQCADLAKPTNVAPTTSSPAVTGGSVTNGSTATEPHFSTSSRPQPASTFTTAATATTANTDFRTQNPTTVLIPHTSNTDVPTTKPQISMTPRPPTTIGIQTTAETQQSTTEQAGSETSQQPELETTNRPQTTARPQPPNTDGPNTPTTAQPKPPTEEHPQTTIIPKPPTTSISPLSTTVRPQPPTTATSQHSTTFGPQPPNETEPQSTVGPQPPTIATSHPTATAGSPPPTETQPQPQTTIKPQPQSTPSPNPPSTATSHAPSAATSSYPTSATATHPNNSATFTTYSTTTTASQSSPETQPQITVKPPTAATSHPSTATTQSTAKSASTHSTETQPQITVKPPTAATSHPSTATTQSTAKSASTHSTETQPQTTVKPLSPTTVRPHPPITHEPLPSTTVKPQPSTTGPLSSTTAKPQPSTTHGPLPTTTVRSKPSTTHGPLLSTTAKPQPSTTHGSLTSTTSKPQPSTTTGPLPSTTAKPQPSTTHGPLSSTTAKPQLSTTHGPLPSTTVRPKPSTTHEPPSSTTAKPQLSTTHGPLPSTAVKPQHSTTQGPLSSTTSKPQHSTTHGSLPSTTARPQHSTTTGPQPSTTAKPRPSTTHGPLPSTTVNLQPSTTHGPLSSTTVRPKPSTTHEPPSSTTAKPQHSTTQGPLSSTTAKPQHSTTHGPLISTTARPQHSTTTGPLSSTTVRPKPSTTHEPPSSTTAKPQHSTTQGPLSSTTSKPQHSTTHGSLPSTTARPQHSTTTGPQPSTTAKPRPSTTHGPLPLTTVNLQPSTTHGPLSSTTVRPKPSTTHEPPSSTTAKPQHSTTQGPLSSTTAKPQHSTTHGPLLSTTAKPQHSTTTGPQPTTNGSHPTTTVRPQPTITATSIRPTTVGPQPTTVGPQPTTIKPHATTGAPTSISPSTTTASTKPSTTLTPTPSCPPNSHYTTCSPACSPTCTYLNGPPGCDENGSCTPGCVCDDGFVQRGRICVPIQQCGCVDRNGKKYQFNEEWYTNHCSEKCECKRKRGSGRIECKEEEECNDNAVCLPNGEGNHYCQSTGFDECEIERDGHKETDYRTFDRLRYDHEGEHSYVLVQTRNLPNNLPEVYIECVNSHSMHDDDDSDQHNGSSSEEDHSSSSSRDEDDDDDDDESDDDSADDDHEKPTSHHRVQELKIRVYNHTVQFKNKRRVVVDGKASDTPVSPSPGLKIYERRHHIYLKTDFGLSVKFDGHDSAEITLPRLYRRKIGGLCGNFDGQSRNDWMKPDGSRAQSVKEFAESWRV